MKNKAFENIIKPEYKKKDSMHNLKHILRIKKKISFLRKDYQNFDEEKLKFLIYFHGLKQFVKKNEKRFLKIFPKEYIAAIYRHTSKPESIEEKLVSDANLLEAVGKFGVNKGLKVGKERGRTLQETIKFMKNNIKTIKFYTKRGKALGNPRIRYMKDWLRKKA